MLVAIIFAALFLFVVLFSVPITESIFRLLSCDEIFLLNLFQVEILFTMLAS